MRRTRPCSRTGRTPAPLGVCSPVHNQQVGVRVTYRQKRSDSGWCRLGNRVAQFVNSFKEAVVIEPSRNNVTQCSSQLRMKRYLALSLYQIAGG